MTHYTSFQLLKEPDDALNPTIEIGDVEFFVGRVQVVVRQAHAHHHAGNFQHVLELGDDGNGAAGADENGIFPKDLCSAWGAALRKDCWCRPRTLGPCCKP